MDGTKEGWTNGSVTISHRNFVGEGIIKEHGTGTVHDCMLCHQFCDELFIDVVFPTCHLI